MADNKSPWDDSDDSPWQGEANTEKVVKFRRIKKSGGFSSLTDMPIFSFSIR